MRLALDGLIPRVARLILEPQARGHAFRRAANGKRPGAGRYQILPDPIADLERRQIIAGYGILACHDRVHLTADQIGRLIAFQAVVRIQEVQLQHGVWNIGRDFEQSARFGALHKLSGVLIPLLRHGRAVL